MELSLHPKQGEAFLSPASEVLYGGAAGGGKSHLLRVAAIAWCVDVAGLQVYLFRRTFPELFKNHMEGPGSYQPPPRTFAFHEWPHHLVSNHCLSLRSYWKDCGR